MGPPHLTSLFLTCSAIKNPLFILALCLFLLTSHRCHRLLHPFLHIFFSFFFPGQSIYMSYSSAYSVDSSMVCFCGSKTGPKVSRSKNNPGRLFFGCPNYREKKCNFFRWVDSSIPGSDNSLLAELEKELKKNKDLTALMEEEKVRSRVVKRKLKNQVKLWKKICIVLSVVIVFLVFSLYFE